MKIVITHAIKGEAFPELPRSIVQQAYNWASNMDKGFKYLGVDEDPIKRLHHFRFEMDEDKYKHFQTLKVAGA